MAPILALAGLVVVLGAMTHYFATIAQERVPRDLRPHGAVIAIGGALGAIAIVMAPAPGTIVLGILAVSFAAFLLWLFGQRRLPDGKLVVGVGDPMPEVQALDSGGRPFRLEDLQGRRVLFKFFRGSW